MLITFVISPNALFFVFCCANFLLYTHSLEVGVFFKLFCVKTNYWNNICQILKSWMLNNTCRNQINISLWMTDSAILVCSFIFRWITSSLTNSSQSALLFLRFCHFPTDFVPLPRSTRYIKATTDGLMASTKCFTFFYFFYFLIWNFVSSFCITDLLRSNQLEINKLVHERELKIDKCRICSTKPKCSRSCTENYKWCPIRSETNSAPVECITIHCYFQIRRGNWLFLVCNSIFIFAGSWQSLLLNYRIGGEIILVVEKFRAFEFCYGNKLSRRIRRLNYFDLHPQKYIVMASLDFGYSAISKFVFELNKKTKEWNCKKTKYFLEQIETL